MDFFYYCVCIVLSYVLVGRTGHATTVLQRRRVIKLGSQLVSQSAG